MRTSQASKHKRKRAIRTAISFAGFLFLLFAFDVVVLSPSNHHNRNHHQRRDGLFQSSGTNARRGRSCENDGERLRETFRRAWLDNGGEEDDDEIDESSRPQRKIISNFKGPLTLHAKLGPKLPKVPKANGEMEDLGLISKSDMKTLPERDALEELRERGFKTCAVVGNGGVEGRSLLMSFT